MKMRQINEAAQAIRDINALEGFAEEEKAIMRADYERFLGDVDTDGNTLLMQIALYGESDVEGDMRDATRSLINSGADITMRNQDGLNVLDLAFLMNESMIKPLLLKAATLPEDQQREMLSRFSVSDEVLDYCLACNRYIAKQAVKLLERPNIADNIDLQKGYLAINALQELITNCDIVPEAQRIEQMRAILSAGSEFLGCKKFGGGFFKKKDLTDGEKLMVAVGINLDPSKKEFEMKPVTQAMRERAALNEAMRESAEASGESSDEESDDEDVAANEGKKQEPEERVIYRSFRPNGGVDDEDL